ncbi:hypothetical protein GE09DRAFT_1189337 [Coniochaeta sp. 2T2.1]|nr:hypothetical protein GE09DRAFT_1189337 [Coniochaeta sp. 2T2.1]
MAPLHDRDYDYLSPYTSPRRSRNYEVDTTYPHPDPSLDAVADFVNRRLVPVRLDRSDRPLHLVMNYGTLRLRDDESDQRGRSAGSSGANAVVYNAPGSTMTMGGGGYAATGATAAGLATRRPSLLSDMEAERTATDGHGGLAQGRRVSICEGCLKRQLISPTTGCCLDCDLSTRDITGGLDGIRYGYGRAPEKERRDERERDLRRKVERIRERERLRDQELRELRELERERLREQRLRELEQERLMELRERRLRRERERRFAAVEAKKTQEKRQHAGSEPTRLTDISKAYLPEIRTSGHRDLIGSCVRISSSCVSVRISNLRQLTRASTAWNDKVLNFSAELFTPSWRGCDLITVPGNSYRNV